MQKAKLLPPVPYSFAGHSVDFISVEKVFGKAFGNFRKCQWVVEQDFIFGSSVSWFFAFFSGLPDQISIMLWYGLKDLINLPKFIADKVVLDH